MNATSFDLTGKTAVVTGARKGIGQAIAVALAEHGADIIGVSSQMDPAGSEVASQVESLGRSFHAIKCDFANHSEVIALTKDLANTQIDILINNSGILMICGIG